MRLAAIVLGVVLLGPLLVPQSTTTRAQQMPDPKQIAGVPLPVTDLEAGTVVVRVIRGSLSNNIPNQPVGLRVDGAVRTAITDATGRAEFKGVKPGSQVVAAAIVGTERLASQEFPVPASGGVRVLLVATDPEAEKKAEEDKRLAQGPPQPGMIVLGEESRFVFEIADDALSVFNIMQIVNTARTPVQTPGPVVFDLPRGAQGAAVLRGSSPQASVSGRHVTVVGPFAPGATLVQFAYSLPARSGDVIVEQPLPIALTRVTVLAQKVGDMQFTSAQITERREMNAEGQNYIVGQGPALKAGDVVTFGFANLPHEPAWPRNLALALAIGILAVGAWGSFRARRGTGLADKRRGKLEARRAQLLAELTELEAQHRSGKLDPARYAIRKRDLLNALERVYADLEQEAAA
jgi:hypothetical protein